MAELDRFQRSGASRNDIVLVTGGAGYIGSVLVGHLLHAGARVRVLDRLSFGGEALLAFVGHPCFELQVGDTADPRSVSSALENVSAVVHLAAVVGDPACARDPRAANRSNIEGSQLVAESARAEQVERFVFSSTCSNYGKMEDPHGFVTESSSLAPVSLYAEQKVWFERFLLDLQTEKFSPTCLRFATAFGLSPRMRFDLTVNEFTRDLFLQRHLDVYGPQFWRPYCHTRDLARACVQVVLADKDAVSGQIFNVGAFSENYRKIELVEKIREELSRGGIATEVNLVEKNEDPRNYRVDFSKIATRLHYKPDLTVSDGIQEIATALRCGTFVDPYAQKHHNIPVGTS